MTRLWTTGATTGTTKGATIEWTTEGMTDATTDVMLHVSDASLRGDSEGAFAYFLPVHWQT